MHLGHLRPAGLDHGAVDEIGVKETRDEVAVLLAECAELCDAEILLVQAPSDEPGFSRGCGSVGVLDLDEPLLPTDRESRCAEVDPVDAEAVLLLEW